MALSPNQFLIYLLLLTTLFSSSPYNVHARDSQVFNKLPPSIPNNDQQPSFHTENGNGYGLYGHESGQLPPSLIEADSKQPLNNHLPTNYNPFVYITPEAELEEDINEKTKFPGEAINANRYYDGGESYYNSQKHQGDSEYRSYPSTTNINRNYEYTGGSSFNSEQQGTYVGGNAGNNANGFKQQGMSDTRFMENGKYFYDVNTEKYSSNHPYDRIRARSENINRNVYGNTGNAYKFIDDVTLN